MACEGNLNCKYSLKTRFHLCHQSTHCLKGVELLVNVILKSSRRSSLWFNTDRPMLFSACLQCCRQPTLTVDSASFESWSWETRWVPKEVWTTRVWECLIKNLTVMGAPLVDTVLQMDLKPTWLCKRVEETMGSMAWTQDNPRERTPMEEIMAMEEYIQNQVVLRVQTQEDTLEADQW